MGEENAPMPEGSNNNKKVLKVQGNGEVELGKIIFKKPGVFTYKVFELSTEDKGWTYDSSVYMMIITVTQENGKLASTCKITKNDEKVDKIIFTNSYKPDINEETEIKGQKTWKHGDNKEENRPNSIIVIVYGNGKPVAQREVTKDDEWKYSFKLPKYDENGDEIVYKIDEVKLEDYDKVVDGYDLLNIYNPDEPDKPHKPHKPDKPNEPNNPNKPNTPNNSDISKTFDNSQLMIYLITMIISVFGLGVSRFIRKRK